MPIQEFETEEEMDDAFDNIQEANEQHLFLEDEVEEAETELEIAKERLKEARKELDDFEARNRSILL